MFHNLVPKDWRNVGQIEPFSRWTSSCVFLAALTLFHWLQDISSPKFSTVNSLSTDFSGKAFLKTTRVVTDTFSGFDWWKLSRFSLGHTFLCTSWLLRIIASDVRTENRAIERVEGQGHGGQEARGPARVHRYFSARLFKPKLQPQTIQPSTL